MKVNFQAADISRTGVRLTGANIMHQLTNSPVSSERFENPVSFNGSMSAELSAKLSGKKPTAFFRNITEIIRRASYAQWLAEW